MRALVCGVRCTTVAPSVTTNSPNEVSKELGAYDHDSVTADELTAVAVKFVGMAKKQGGGTAPGTDVERVTGWLGADSRPYTSMAVTV